MEASRLGAVSNLPSSIYYLSIMIMTFEDLESWQCKQMPGRPDMIPNHENENDHGEERAQHRPRAQKCAPSVESSTPRRRARRSATSVGANYREANRGVSRGDFANKIGNVQKEAAEVQYWIELLIDSGIATNSSARDLHKESSELLAIFTSIGRKLKQ